MFARILALVKKELLAAVLDKKSRVQIVVAPIIMLFLFSFAVTMEVKNTPFAVLNSDRGEMGQRLVSLFSNNRTFSKIIKINHVNEIQRVIENQESMAALNIPSDFSEKLLSGRAVSLQIILDGRKINSAQILYGYISNITNAFSKELSKALPAQGPRIQIQTRQFFNPNLDFIWFTMPVLLVLLTQLLTLIISALSIARERELGTFEQLMVSPLSPIEIIIGKTIPAVGIALTEGVVIHTISTKLFGAPFVGSLALMLFSFLLFSLAVTGIGLFISSLCTTQQQAFLGAFSYMVPAVLLSGFATPIENMPAGLQKLTLINPVRHIIKISIDLYLKDASLQNIYSELLSLAAIAFVTLTFATWFFKKKIQ